MGQTDHKYGTIIDMDDLRERIKAEMGRQEIGIGKLSAMTGIPKSTIDNFINTSTVPAFDRVYQITTALGLEIVEQPPDIPEDAPAQHGNTSEYVNDMNAVHQQEKTDIRENQRYAIDALKEAYENEREITQQLITSLKKEKRIWCILAVVMIAFICVWFIWDITSPACGIIRYNRSLVGPFAKG